MKKEHSYEDEFKSTQTTIRISPLTKAKWERLAFEDNRKPAQWLDNIIKTEYKRIFGDADPYER